MLFKGMKRLLYRTILEIVYCDLGIAVFNMFECFYNCFCSIGIFLCMILTV